MFKVNIRIEDPELMPERAHLSDAGADLRANDYHTILPGTQQLIDTGVAVQIPEGFVGMVFNRSSQGKVGVQIANGTGIIDSDYRGNIKVLLKNTGQDAYEILARNTRIAQLVIVPIVLPKFIEHTGSEDDWFNTLRSSGGFGSTGV